jgi:hypothetical protein
MVSHLPDALNKNFVSKFFSVDAVPDDGLDGRDLLLALQFAACVLAQIL